MSKGHVLDVFLGSMHVGELREEPHGRSTFRFTTEYLEGSPRPVLSQSFLDDPSATYEGKHFALPSFFSNLLPDPDGKLRALIAQQVGVKPNRELYLLSALGEDLPGAVVVRPRGALGLPDETHSTEEHSADREVRFSARGTLTRVRLGIHPGLRTIPLGQIRVGTRPQPRVSQRLQHHVLSVRGESRCRSKRRRALCSRYGGLHPGYMGNAPWGTADAR